MDYFFGPELTFTFFGQLIKILSICIAAWIFIIVCRYIQAFIRNYDPYRNKQLKEERKQSERFFYGSGGNQALSFEPRNPYIIELATTPLLTSGDYPTENGA
jgi:hypothetical protein